MNSKMPFQNVNHIWAVMSSLKTGVAKLSLTMYPSAFRQMSMYP